MTSTVIRKNPNVWADISALFYRPWSQWECYRYATEWSVLHKMLFGTDFPVATLEETIAGTRRVDDVGKGGCRADPGVRLRLHRRGQGPEPERLEPHAGDVPGMGAQAGGEARGAAAAGGLLPRRDGLPPVRETRAPTWPGDIRRRAHLRGP